jgi:hypothetical protein
MAVLATNSANSGIRLQSGHWIDEICHRFAMQKGPVLRGRGIDLGARHILRLSAPVLVAPRRPFSYTG